MIISDPNPDPTYQVISDPDPQHCPQRSPAHLLDEGPVGLRVLDVIVISLGLEALVLPILGVLHMLVVGVVRSPLRAVPCSHTHRMVNGPLVLESGEAKDLNNRANSTDQKLSLRIRPFERKMQ